VTRNKKHRELPPRTLHTVEKNADEIDCLTKQVGLINHYLGVVLQISDFVVDRQDEQGSLSVMEQIRQRVKWNEEAKKAQENDPNSQANSYKTD
jgi:hypothetical protein